MTFLGQLWKLQGTTLINKANLWNSNDKWNFKSKGETICIENTSENLVLENSDDNEVSEEPFDEDRLQQCWIKGEADSEGYFTITNSNSKKVLTSTLKSNLEVRGKL